MSVGSDVARVISTLRTSIRAGDHVAADHVAFASEVADDGRRSFQLIGALSGMYLSAMDALAIAAGHDPDELLDRMLASMIDQLEAL